MSDKDKILISHAETMILENISGLRSLTGLTPENIKLTHAPSITEKGKSVVVKVKLIFPE